MATKAKADALNVLKADDVAALLCRTKRQVTNLVDQGLPKHGNGRDAHFVWSEVLNWWIDYQIALRKPYEAQTEPNPVEIDGENYDQALTRKTIAEANLKELELARERGEVVAVADVEKNIADVATNVKAKLLAIPAKLASVLAAQKGKPQIRAVLDSEMRQICAELATMREDGDAAAV